MADQPDYFSEYERQLIQNFKPSAVSGFSEFMVQQGAVSSFHRLFLDPFSRVMYSSRAEEHDAVKQYVSQGMGVAQSVQRVADDLYGSELQQITRVGK